MSKDTSPTSKSTVSSFLKSFFLGGAQRYPTVQDNQETPLSTAKSTAQNSLQK